MLRCKLRVLAGMLRTSQRRVAQAKLRGKDFEGECQDLEDLLAGTQVLLFLNIVN